MKIYLTQGTGTGPTSLAAFDASLLDAGVENYNLLSLSSVIPPHSQIEAVERYEAPPEEYGHRLYVVMATHRTTKPGDEVWAGLGWTQDDTGKGLFVEIKGNDKCQVETEIKKTLEAMIASRDITYGPIHCHVTGIKCVNQPVCATVIAVYESQGWSNGSTET